LEKEAVPDANEGQVRELVWDMSLHSRRGECVARGGKREIREGAVLYCVLVLPDNAVSRSPQVGSVMVYSQGYSMDTEKQLCSEKLV